MVLHDVICFLHDFILFLYDFTWFSYNLYGFSYESADWSRCLDYWSLRIKNNLWNIEREARFLFRACPIFVRRLASGCWRLPFSKARIHKKAEWNPNRRSYTGSFHMVFTSFSYVFIWFSYVFTWFSYGFHTVFTWFPYGLIWFSYDVTSAKNE